MRSSQTKAVRKNRKYWAAEIRAIHTGAVKRLVDDSLKIGRKLIAAKKALEHGEFEKMIERELPFDASTAQRLMKIARDPRLRNAARVQLLPTAWGTLYELTKLSDAEFKQAADSGKINPEMTRKQASRLVPVRVTYSKMVNVVPHYIKSEEPTIVEVVPHYVKNDANPRQTDDAPDVHDDESPLRLVDSTDQPTDVTPSDIEPLALSQIERLAGDLAIAIERGDVRVDAVFKGRVRAVTDRLLTAIADDRPAMH